MKRIIFIAVVILTLVCSTSGCKDLSDVSLTERETFIKFFSGPGDFEARDAKQTTDGGYICLGTITGALEPSNRSQLFLFKLDSKGNELWSTKIDDADGKSLLIIDDGYLIIGDKVNNIDELESKTEMLLLKTNNSGDVTAMKTLFDTRLVDEDKDKFDFHGDALTLTPDNIIITLTTQELESDVEIATITAYALADLDSLWQQPYSFENRSYKNGKSVFITSNNGIIWANSQTLIDDENFDSYLGISVASPNSEIKNLALFGDLVPDNYEGVDITKRDIGFAVVGTKTNIDGDFGEIFMLRAATNGVIQPLSAQRFSFTNNDRGLSIAATKDNEFVLLGTITTSIVDGQELGNGGRDFYLFKVNEAGDIRWKFNLGGTGDETDGVVRQDQDGGYFVFGTSVLQGVSSIVFIKTDDKGELKD